MKKNYAGYIPVDGAVFTIRKDHKPAREHFAEIRFPLNAYTPITQKNLGTFPMGVVMRARTALTRGFTVFYNPTYNDLFAFKFENEWEE